MEVTHSSSSVPQVTVNNLPGAEDTSIETPGPVPRPLEEASYDRHRKPSLQEILETASTTMDFISTITTAFHERGDQNSRFREGKIRYIGRIQSRRCYVLTKHRAPKESPDTGNERTRVGEREGRARTHSCTGHSGSRNPKARGRRKGSRQVVSPRSQVDLWYARHICHHCVWAMLSLLMMIFSIKIGCGRVCRTCLKPSTTLWPTWLGSVEI